MARYRTYTVEFKRRLVEEHLGEGTSLNRLARRHDTSRELLRGWGKKYEAGEFAGDGPARPDRRGPQGEEARLVARIHEICAEFPRYGYRRVTAQLKAEGERVNHKRVARIMREQDLRVRPKRRFVVTTDSDHHGPIFPDLAKDLAPTGPDQLWVADLTYIRILSGFVYLAVILDAWSRRVVGWAISRRIDADLALAALEAAITSRRPPPGCVHHSDRGSQGGFKRSSQHLDGGGCDGYSKAALGAGRTSQLA